MTRTKGKPYTRLGGVSIKVLIVVVTISFGGLGMGFGLREKPVQYKITWKTPHEGGFVDRTNVVRGTIYPKPEGSSVWIFEQPSFGDAYPQRASIQSNGDFEMKMPFGDEAHPECEFQLYGMVLPPETHFRQMDKIKISEVPKGQKITPISAKRK